MDKVNDKELLIVLHMSSNSCSVKEATLLTPFMCCFLFCFFVLFSSLSEKYVLYHSFVMLVLQNHNYFSSYAFNHLLGFREAKLPKINILVIMLSLMHQIKLFSSITIEKIKEKFCCLYP